MLNPFPVPAFYMKAFSLCRLQVVIDRIFLVAITSLLVSSVQFIALDIYFIYKRF